MARVSLVGDGHGGSEDYATLALWFAAESGTDYGSAMEAQCLGDCGSVQVLSGSVFYKPKIYTLGVTYDGTNESSLATVERLDLDTLIEFTDFMCTSSNAFNEALEFRVDGSTISRLRITQVGTSRSAWNAIGAQPNTIASQIVANGGDDVTSTNDTNYCDIRNCVHFGASSRNFEGAGGLAPTKPITDTFAFDSVTGDFEASQNALTTCASEDLTGNLTGFTSSELVDFAGNDFRTKLTSTLATAGTLTAYVGAFLESGGSGITVTLDSGSYSLTGTDVILIDPPADETIVINTGSYSISGTNINLVADYREDLSSGSYAYTGTDVILIDPIIPGSIIIDPGSYALTGTLIQTAIKTQINSGSYALTGTAINFAITRGMTIEAGSYIIQGTDIEFSNTGNIWTDKPSVVTLWGDKTPVTTNWTDK